MTKWDLESRNQEETFKSWQWDLQSGNENETFNQEITFLSYEINIIDWRGGGMCNYGDILSRDLT